MATKKRSTNQKIVAQALAGIKLLSVEFVEATVGNIEF